MNVDTLITGAILITMNEGREVFMDGAIAMVGDRIAAVGRCADVEAQVTARETIDGRGFVITPGFVNTHVHITEPLIRGFTPEALPFDEGLMRWTIPLYEGQTPEEQGIGARLAILSMLRTGTTTFLEAGTMIAFDEIMAAIEGTGIRARTGRWTLDRAFDPAQDQSGLTDAAAKALAADIEHYPDDGRLIAAWPNLIGHQTATDELWRRAKAMADENGLGVSAHMGPASNDAAWYRANEGEGPIEHLDAIGVLGPNINLVHMVHISAEEVPLLARSGTSVTLCPSNTLKGGYGASAIGLYPEMAEAGVNIALGTDGSDTHDMMRSITLMAGLFKDARMNTSLFPAHQAFEMATLGGAKAMGMADQIGSLEVGKKADIVLHDTNRPEWRPLNNPINQIVWSADGRGVHSVWVDGVRVVDAFRCTTIDEPALLAEAQAAGEAVIARSGLPLLTAWPIIQ
jgi:5-methylthioadenosine/S-adenosylhomocysteine deaminase